MIRLDKIEREFQRIRLKNKQKYLNKLFELYGLTEDILREQLKINKERSELDIPDEKEIINKEGFVQ